MGFEKLIEDPFLTDIIKFGFFIHFEFFQI
jgi:hypothetical protein